MELEVWMPSQRELNRTFLKAFIDGMTGVGLFVRLRIPYATLDFNDTRTIEWFAHQEDPVAAIQAYNKGHRLTYRYAMAGLTAGATMFVGILGGFCYLVTRGVAH
jgi:hypothetical protein